MSAPSAYILHSDTSGKHGIIRPYLSNQHLYLKLMKVGTNKVWKLLHIL